MKRPAASGTKAAAAKKKIAASHAAGAGGSGGGSAPKAAHPNAKAARSVKAKAAAKKKTAAAAHKPRKWSPDSDVACCSARAVAEAIRIALRVPVSDDDVLRLYWSVAPSTDAGASIMATLRAAGVRQVKESAVIRKRQRGEHVQAEPLALPGNGRLYGSGQPAHERHALILGLDLPYGEPHAITVDIDGTWWSWGEPHSPDDFAGATIDEAWAVTCAG